MSFSMSLKTFVGHLATQMPHEVHRCSSTTGSPRSMWMAASGQDLTHISHLMQPVLHVAMTFDFTGFRLEHRGMAPFLARETLVRTF